ncbi:hypothetical protein ACFL2Q_06755 [Thermodesulfobacteriota bacterium]
MAPYLAGIAWPRTPLAFSANLQSWPDPIAPGRYEWLVPVVDVKKPHEYKDIGADKIPRCVYVKANYVKVPCGPVPVAAPPPMPYKVKK